jgi:hypothetical protein
MGFMGLTFRIAHGVRPSEMKQAETSGSLEGVVVHTHGHRNLRNFSTVRRVGLLLGSCTWASLIALALQVFGRRGKFAR